MAQEKIVAPRKFSGYVQSAKTAEGFARMKRRGIVLPPFQIEQACAAAIGREFEDLVAEFEKETVLKAAHVGVGVSDADLSEWLILALKTRLVKLMQEDKKDPAMIRKMAHQLQDAQQEFFTEFLDDASDTVRDAVAFGLEKDEVFQERLDTMRRGYLDTAVERINGGKSELRKRFIEMLDDWISGRRPDLSTLEDVMTKIRREAMTFSRFFARDQFSRFNKALTIASYEEAGAKWVRWMTIQDGRVRKTHRLLLGKIFRIDDLPKEYADYNCRCAFLPIFTLTKAMTVQRGDGLRLVA